jgi:hypothetical protein
MNEAERLAVLNGPLDRPRGPDERRVQCVEFSVEKWPAPLRLSLTLDWGVGVGGGLWAAGKLLISQIASRPETFQEQMKGRRVLELVSEPSPLAAFGRSRAASLAPCWDDSMSPEVY